jgi:ASPIC/UnbV protein
LSAVAHIKEYKTGKFYRDEFRGDISWNGYEHNVLLRNEGMVPVEGEGKNKRKTLRFTDVAMALGADDVKDGRGMAIADFNNDGALDIVINNNPGDSGDVSRSRPSLLRNNIGSRRNWLAVELSGRESNRDGVGATVTIETGDTKQLRLVSAGSGFASQNSARLYFGLNTMTQVEALTVRWPSGRVERFERVGDKSITTRQLVRVTEGNGIQSLTLPTK